MAEPRCADRLRGRVGLPPLAPFVEPPAPVSDDRKTEILADPRVVASMPKDTKARAARDCACASSPAACAHERAMSLAACSNCLMKR